MTDSFYVLDARLLASLVVEMPFLQSWQPILDQSPTIVSRLLVEPYDRDAKVTGEVEEHQDEFTGKRRRRVVRAWIFGAWGCRMVPAATECRVADVSVDGDLAAVSEVIDPTGDGLRISYTMRPVRPPEPPDTRIEAEVMAREVCLRLGFAAAGALRDPVRRSLTDDLDRTLGPQLETLDRLNARKPLPTTSADMIEHQRRTPDAGKKTNAPEKTAPAPTVPAPTTPAPRAAAARPVATQPNTAGAAPRTRPGLPTAGGNRGAGTPSSKAPAKTPRRDAPPPPQPAPELEIDEDLDDLYDTTIWESPAQKAAAAAAQTIAPSPAPLPRPSEQQMRQQQQREKDANVMPGVGIAPMSIDAEAEDQPQEEFELPVSGDGSIEAIRQALSPTDLADYPTTRQELLERAEELLDMLPRLTREHEKHQTDAALTSEDSLRRLIVVLTRGTGAEVAVARKDLAAAEKLWGFKPGASEWT